MLCESAEPGDLSQATSVVEQVFGRGFTVEVREESIVSVTRGDDIVGVLGHMAMPIPGGEAEDSADGNFLWPEGKEAAVRHRSHVIVTSIGAEEQTPIQSAMTVSRLALVALKLFDGLGVYWGDASVSNSRENFEYYCEDMSVEHPPVPMWLRFQLIDAGNEELGIYTLGMQQFGLMNLEVDRCKLDVGSLFDFVSNIALYLIQSGPVIKDGNTVGGSEDERILVRHQASMIDEDRTVYKIIFEE